MALKETIDQVKELLLQLSEDLEKAAKGNRSAAQRVRTGTISLAKVSKIFRKESLDAERVVKKKPSSKKR